MNQEILDQLQKEEGIHIMNPDEKSKLLETVDALLRSVEELRTNQRSTYCVRID